MGSRIWLWPNLLSLDAPIVALLWQILFVRCLHAELGVTTAMLLAGSVWLIYAADRILDAWRGTVDTERHQFYRRHWVAIVPIWVVVFALSSWAAWTALPTEMCVRGLTIGAATVLYLLAVHGLPRAWGLRGGKEAAVGAVFALGVTLAAWPMVRTGHDVVAIALFGVLCWTNCVAIEDWESGTPARASVWIAAAAVALTAVLLLRESRPVLGCAEAASALGLAAIDNVRDRVSPEAMRVLADVALLSPLLFLHVAGTVV